MQTNYIQALLTTNARIIAMRQSLIAINIDDAKAYKASGETAYAVDAYAKAGRQRTKLAKVVEVQRALKAELAANFRLARIEAKIAKLKTVGFKRVEDEPRTSREIEADLDEMIAIFFAPKRDSRVAIPAGEVFVN